MNQRKLGGFCSLIVLALSASPPAAARQDVTSWCGTHVAQGAENRYLRLRSMERRYVSTLSLLSLAPPAPRDAAGNPANEDIGEIAVIGADPGILVQRNPFNLDFRTVTFHLVGGGTRYAITTGESSLDTSLLGSSERLALGDDDSVEVTLPFDFPFYGETYRKLFVNSDGNLTFGQPDDASSERSLGRMVAGPPRIAALFTDLDPSVSASGVRVNSTPQQFTLTWQSVPLFTSSGAGQRQNFQLRLFPEGRVELTFQDMRMSGADAVVGIAPGRQRNGLDLLPLTVDPVGEFAGAIGDRFAGFETVDLATAAQRFFETHEDAYDYLVIFNALGLRTNNAGAIAFEDTVRNSITGFGDAQYDFGEVYGSRKRLQALMYMGPWEQYPADINAPFPQRVGTGETGLSVLGHEASHRFLAYSSVTDDFGRALMFGRDAVHWGFNFNSEGSLTEGNRIVDEGQGANPRFFAAGAAERIAPLDQYFFGFRAPEDVPGTFVVLNSTGPSSTSAPRPGVRFNGTRRDIFVDELIGIVGPRIPDHQVAQRKYRFGWVVIGPLGQRPDVALERIERYRAEWESYWSRVSEGRSTAEATMKRALDVSLFPHKEIAEGETVRATVRIERALEQAMTVRLEVGDRTLVDMPESVSIAAGETAVDFDVTAKGKGVVVVTAVPELGQFESVESRVRVR